MSTGSVKKHPRDRFFFVIIMPLNEHGQGPCDISSAVEITWQVWDQLCTSHASFNFLLDAIALAEELNEAYDKGTELADGNHA